MTYEQAAAFAQKLIGSELCTNAGEDEGAQYLVSPIARAFLEGAVGAANLPVSMWYFQVGGRREGIRLLGEFLRDAGQSLVDGPKQAEPKSA